jgi:hypothetical protein
MIPSLQVHMVKNVVVSDKCVLCPKSIYKKIMKLCKSS